MTDFANPMDLPPIQHSLSAETVESIKAKAEIAAKKEIEKRDQDALFKQEKEAAIRRMERERAVGPDDVLVRVHIQLAPHAQYVKLDGVAYYEGFLYDLPVDKARVLLDTMSRTWAHEREIGGANINHSRTAQNTVLRPAQQQELLH